MRGPRRAAVAVAAVVLVGCTGLSVDTPVEAGLELGERVQPPVRVVYPGPGIDADQESIVTGFLRAGGASDGAYDVARSFLTTQASTKWAPDSAVVVLAPLVWCVLPVLLLIALLAWMVAQLFGWWRFKGF